MKKLIALLITAALTLSFAACGGPGKNAPSEPNAEDTAAEAPQGDEGTEEAAEAPADEPQDDAALAEAEKAKLIGEWNMSGVDDILLTFNEDGTGAYKFLTEKNITFTYLVSVSHKEYGNGEPYDDYLLNLSYDTGDVEDIIFFFNDETGNLVFHNSDNGGYSGVIDYNEWTRK